MELNLEDIEDNQLWPILVDIVHSLVMYKPHKQYISDLLEKEPPPDPELLSLNLGITLGETLVILKELLQEKSKYKD